MKYKGDQIKDGMDGTCKTDGRHVKCIQYFGWKTWREDATWKT